MFLDDIEFPRLWAVDAMFGDGEESQNHYGPDIGLYNLTIAISV